MIVLTLAAPMTGKRGKSDIEKLAISGALSPYQGLQNEKVKMLPGLIGKRTEKAGYRESGNKSCSWINWLS